MSSDYLSLVTTGQKTLEWADSKSYVSITVTLTNPSSESAMTGTLTINWTNDPTRSFLIATDTNDYNVPAGGYKTFQYDMRARWVKISANVLTATIGSNASILFKYMPTEIKLVDNSKNIVSVIKGDKNSMSSIFADISGYYLGTAGTVGTTGEGLYTHLTDASGSSLYVVNNTLGVALNDNSGYNIHTTRYTGSGLLKKQVLDTSLNVHFLVSRGYDMTLFLNVDQPLGFTADTSGSIKFTSIANISLGDTAIDLSAVKLGYSFTNDATQARTYITEVSGNEIYFGGNDIGVRSGERFTFNKRLLFSKAIDELAVKYMELVDSYPTNFKNKISTYVIGGHITGNAIKRYTAKANYYQSFNPPVNFDSTYNDIYDSICQLPDDASEELPSGDNILVIISKQLDYVDSTLQDASGILDTFNEVYIVSTVDDGYLRNLIRRGAATDSNHYNLITPTLDASYASTFTYLSDAFISENFTNSNALFITSTDICGNPHASTTQVSGSLIPGVSMYYALADNCGAQISTSRKQPDGSGNGLFVSLLDGSGNNISLNNPLYINANDVYSTQIVATSIDNILSSLIPTGAPTTLMSLHLANETATTIWIKLYDIGPSTAEIPDYFSNGNANISNNIVLNMAIPPLTYRDIPLQTGIKLDHGLVVRASTGYKYDASAFSNIGSDEAYIDLAYTVDEYISSDPTRLRFSGAETGVRNFNSAKLGGWTIMDATTFAFGLTRTEDVTSSSVPIVNGTSVGLSMELYTITDVCVGSYYADTLYRNYPDELPSAFIANHPSPLDASYYRMKLLYGDASANIWTATKDGYNELTAVSFRLSDVSSVVIIKDESLLTSDQMLDVRSSTISQVDFYLSASGPTIVNNTIAPQPQNTQRFVLIDGCSNIVDVSYNDVNYYGENTTFYDNSMSYFSIPEQHLTLYGEDTSYTYSLKTFSTQYFRGHLLKALNPADNTATYDICLSYYADSPDASYFVHFATGTNVAPVLLPYPKLIPNGSLRVTGIDVSYIYIDISGANPPDTNRCNVLDQSKNLEFIVMSKGSVVFDYSSGVFDNFTSV